MFVFFVWVRDLKQLGPYPAEVFLDLGSIHPRPFASEKRSSVPRIKL